MEESVITRALWRAAMHKDFRQRSREDLGAALAEECFILSDAEMRYLRDCWERLEGLSDRQAQERIGAMARLSPGIRV